MIHSNLSMFHRELVWQAALQAISEIILLGSVSNNVKMLPTLMILVDTVCLIVAQGIHLMNLLIFALLFVLSHTIGTPQHLNVWLSALHLHQDTSKFLIWAITIVMSTVQMDNIEIF